MVAPIGFIVNSSKCIKGLDKYESRILEKIKQGIKDSAFRIEGEVKESMAGRRGEPRSFDTGNMTRLVTTNNSQDFVSYVYGGAEYTQYLERGTSRIVGRWHFKNTMIREKPTILGYMKEAVKK